MNQDAFSFIVYMVHELANITNKSPAYIYNKLKNSGCINNYLVPHYDILHTQGSEYIIHDIQMYLKNRGECL